ncbi:MAG: hypothetical protein AAB632_00765 [Patescibacteria group bacterium]
MSRVEHFTTIGGWWKFSSAANAWVYKVKTLKGEAFQAALGIVIKSMPKIPGRKSTDKLNEKQLADIKDVLRLGIALGILPVKVPSSWKECNTFFRELETSKHNASGGFITRAVWRHADHWYSHSTRLLELSKTERATRPLGEVWEDFPQCLETIARILVNQGVLNPFKVLDFKTLYSR